jgi:hypothetical protein
MAIGSMALAHFLIVLVIGIAVGLFLHRYERSLLARVDSTIHSDITSALVGIAGAFIGFHLGAIVGLLQTPVILHIAAMVGAVVVVWVWRGR